MNAESLKQIRESELNRQGRLDDRILCCIAAGCLSGGAREVRAALEREAQAPAMSGAVEVCGTGCMGWCSRGPLVRSSAGKTVYTEVRPQDAPAIVSRQRERFEGRLVDDEHPFYAGQRRLILANSGHADPERIADYVARGGYQALLRAATEMTPEEIVAEVRRSGLRGRGGAGYPAGLKWELVARQSSPVKYVVCNADEGDPGAFMNRSVLEGDPHRVLEGMAIAAARWARNRAYIYARGESPLAIARLQTAIEQAQRRRPAGRTACSKATSISESICASARAPMFAARKPRCWLRSKASAGSRFRARRIRPKRGLWKQPTLINNVETFANIPAIIEKGGDWFASIGSPASPGTKVFALAGRIARTGLVEVPIGTPLRTILFDLGGGVPAGYEFKAAQTGGPAGGCIPAQYLDAADGLRLADAHRDHDGLRRLDRDGHDPPAWWIWRDSSWSSAWTNPAANAFPAAPAPFRCTTSWRA